MLRVLAGGEGRKGVATAEPSEVAEALDQLAREGARRMIAQALELEVAEYLARHTPARGEDGRALAVRNGRARPRRVTLGAGTVKLEAPRVNDKRVVARVRQKFTSATLPPYLRRSPKVSEVLPLLYLCGLSTGDFREALGELLGDEAALSPSAITRLTAAWSEEREEWRRRSLEERD